MSSPRRPDALRRSSLSAETIRAYTDSPTGDSAEGESKVLHKRGWGLQIIEGLMDDVLIESGAAGTTVVMVKAR